MKRPALLPALFKFAFGVVFVVVEVARHALQFCCYSSNKKVIAGESAVVSSADVDLVVETMMMLPGADYSHRSAVVQNRFPVFERQSTTVINRLACVLM